MKYNGNMDVSPPVRVALSVHRWQQMGNVVPATLARQGGDVALKEHLRDTTKATHATRAKTELVDHCLTKGHMFNFDNVATLAREHRWGPRKFVESWFIRRNQSACNSNCGPLPDVYGSIIHK